MQKYQEVANLLMNVDGGGPIQGSYCEDIQAFLMPYLQRITKRRAPLTIEQLYALHA
jgi:hypothetical protein